MNKNILYLIDMKYGSMQCRTKLKGWGRLAFNKEEFTEWFFSQDNFKELYFNWCIYGFRKNLVPSVDRIEDDKPYVFSNMQLMTWRQNKDKWYKGKSSRKGNVNTKNNYKNIVKALDVDLAHIIADKIDKPMCVNDIKRKLSGIIGGNRVGFILNKYRNEIFDFKIDREKPNGYLIEALRS